MVNLATELEALAQAGLNLNVGQALSLAPNLATHADAFQDKDGIKVLARKVLMNLRDKEGKVFT